MKLAVQVVLSVLVSAGVIVASALVALHPNAIAAWVVYVALALVMAFFVSAGVRYWIDVYSEWRW